ncbi:MAG: hypothetical protein GX958_09110 [Desulfitobacterium sp.]|nr:hypothetical protein [Desulfitobacterium sp.]
MQVKIFRSLSHSRVEEQINAFLKEMEGKIEVVDIQWKAFLEHYVMILYKLE